MEHRRAKLSPLPKSVGAVESPMLIGADIVLPVGGPGCLLLGPAWDTAPGSWGAAINAAYQLWAGMCREMACGTVKLFCTYQSLGRG